MDNDAQTFLQDMVGRRGYVHDFHRVLAEHDLEFLQAYEHMIETAYHRHRGLRQLTKELTYVGILSAVGTTDEHLKAHMGAAAAEGATAGDVLEILELLVPTAGVPRFIAAIKVWREVFES